MRSKIRPVLVAIALLLVVSMTASAVSNVGLPTHSQIVERLSAAEKARLAETFHLRETLGDEVWMGWGQVQIPIVVHNEAYAFLVGYPEGESPPEGWVVRNDRVCRDEAAGRWG
jgi:hypothetical protein